MTAVVQTKQRPRKERPENAARRRRQIIDATIRSIVKNGLGGTTLATVATEAGLSQGVAVFYFKNKQALLGAVMRHQYELYQQGWEAALAASDAAPIHRLLAMVRADFDPAICNPEQLVIWHAFWGESGARPHFAETADGFDAARFRAMQAVCADLTAGTGRPASEAAAMATAIDALTDGLWLRIYLSTGAMTREAALGIVTQVLSALFPEHAAAIEAGLTGDAS